MRELSGRISGSKPFEYFIIALILGNAVVLGLETVERIGDEFLTWFELAHNVTLAIFIVEAAMKLLALAPRSQRYFQDGWNIFDFSIIVLSLIPAVGPFAVVARMARLMRVLRLVSAMPELRLIVSTLVRSIPGMLHIVAVMSVLTYIYAILGFHFFHEHDPEHWRNLGISLLSLFRVVTLEDWTDIMYSALEHHWWAWAYFVSFVVAETFVILNLFVAVVINSLEEAKHDRLQEIAAPPTHAELLAELSRTREALGRLEERLERT